MSASFHTLRIKDIKRSTADSVIISFDLPIHLIQAFHFKQGQYLTLKSIINGEEVRRSYSLCSSPLDQEWKVGIKKVEGGKFSTYANEVLKVGDQLEVMPAQGHFYTNVEKSAARTFVCYAAGSGITPMLSIIKTHLLEEPKSKFKLFYVNQRASTVMLKEELEALKNQFMDRLEVFYFLTKQKRNIPFLNGRLSVDKLEIIHEKICNLSNIDHHFICGPEAMILDIKDYLTSKGAASASIHFELFGTNQKANENQKIELAESLKGQRCELTIIEGGKQMELNVEQGAENVLDVALNNSADLPFACKGGVCATCKAKVIEGEVEMLLSYGLEADEIEEGYILTCQSIPITEKLIVDFDS